MTEREMSPTCPLQKGGPNLYYVQGVQGQVIITEYNVFPGIWLSYKDAHTLAFENLTGYPNDLLEITHCRKGRLEYEGEERYFYLGEGDMSSIEAVETRQFYAVPPGITTAFPSSLIRRQHPSAHLVCLAMWM